MISSGRQPSRNVLILEGFVRSSSDRDGARTVPRSDNGSKSAPPTCPVAPVNSIRMSFHRIIRKISHLGQTLSFGVSLRERRPTVPPFNRKLRIVPANHLLGVGGIILVTLIEEGGHLREHAESMRTATPNQKQEAVLFEQ